MSIKEQLIKTHKASKKLTLLAETSINKILMELASEIEQHKDDILSANKKDLNRMDTADPKYDRLKLTEERLNGIATDVRNVAAMKSPLGKILDEGIRPNGMKIRKLSVPFGVIGIIYEARPNVTIDVFALCLKSGNACILKGGSDAEYSNNALIKIIHKILINNEVSTDVAVLLPTEREATAELLSAHGLVDLIIPRGSQKLINYVRENSSIPVIETGAGICHTYFDEFGDVEKGKNIVNNAKTRRPGVCNSLDCLIIHSSQVDKLPELCSLLPASKVIIYADKRAFDILRRAYPDNLLQNAKEEHFGTEFLDYKMAIKTVDSFDEALEHIDKYSSKHSECIISEDLERKVLFRKLVDASSVYSNVSTAFTDGSQFGLGAEIGISTQKLHARGPMALSELTSYKWLIDGDGQIRT
ncbi:MAG: glutamate-5-semialdehyde dehydrogenase [Bacteroidales bacterium]